MSTAIPVSAQPGAGLVPPAATVATHLPASRAGALLAFAHFAFFTITLAVLASAIGWPDVLREPPAVVFERITAEMTATRLGYFSYLFSSMLMIPLAFLLRELFARSGTFGWWVDSLAFLGAAAGVLKTIGIVRWLLTMPTLAREHAAAATDAARATVEAVYIGVNAYGGSIGEVLGVQLFSGLWFAGISLALLVNYGKKLVGGFGLLVAALTLALASRPFFPEVGVLEIVGGPLWLLWLLGLSAMLWRGKARGVAR